MNLSKLFLLQSELDAHIEKGHPRKEKESRHKKKVLAQLVELGELANETRCFKFWSNKPASEKAVVLEEFVDNIHFLLSIGLENNIKEFELSPIKLNNLIDQFLGVFSAFSTLSVAFTPKTYSQAFSAYIGLGEMLGFTWEEIEQAYLDKNEVNHQRQDGGY